MRQYHHSLHIATHGRGMHDITDQVRLWVGKSGIQDGLLTLFIQHTSAGLLIQENADPTVQHDLERFFSRLVPDGSPLFQHDQEGADDMPAHVRAALTPTSLGIPVRNGVPALGHWQGIYLYEYKQRPGHRTVLLHLIGE
ncbi:MAG: secondary thiamine-phosphate synthase enzyme YjbQ [Sulfuricella sp.]|nr:secondary thiamine-phosphate synthase enzyme YjbQ [Sulfuricella sp.]